MVRPHFLQRRAARFLSTAFTPLSTGEVGLFNDSGIAQVLRVWLAFGSGDSQSMPFLGAFKGRLTTQDSGVVSQIIVDEPRVPGRVDTQDRSPAHAFDFSSSTPAGAQPGYGEEWPVAIIKPGWTFFIASNPAPGNPVRAAMLWDWVFADELDEPLSDRDTFRKG